MTEDERRSWKKVEAVYLAMIETSREGNQANPKLIRNYSLEKIGEGPVKANDMLNKPYSKYKKMFNNGTYARPSSYIGYRWFTDTIVSSGLPSLFGIKQQAVYLDMLLTEMEQIIESNMKYINKYNGLLECLKNQSGDTCHDLEINLYKLIKNEMGEKMSDTLKKHLK